MEQAALMYEAHHPQIARQRVRHCWQQWRWQAPLAVATLERAVEHTVVW